MADDILTVERLSLSFNKMTVLRDVSFQVPRGSIFSIIGPNGSGKTSLLNCVNRFYKPDSGRILFDGIDATALRCSRMAGLGIGRTFQSAEFLRDLTVMENVKFGRHVHMRAGILQAAWYYGKARREEQGAEKELTEGILLPLGLEEAASQVVGGLAHGMRKKVDLARALATKPKLLLLDEPMAGADPAEREDLARLILDINQRMGITIVLIEHDMSMVMGVSEIVCVLEFGSVISQGPPAEIQEDREVIRAYLGKGRG